MHNTHICYDSTCWCWKHEGSHITEKQITIYDQCWCCTMASTLGFLNMRRSVVASQLCTHRQCILFCRYVPLFYVCMHEEKMSNVLNWYILCWLYYASGSWLWVWFILCCLMRSKHFVIITSRWPLIYLGILHVRSPFSSHCLIVLWSFCIHSTSTQSDIFYLIFFLHRVQRWGTCESVQKWSGVHWCGWPLQMRSHPPPWLLCDTTENERIPWDVKVISFITHAWCV